MPSLTHIYFTGDIPPTFGNTSDKPIPNDAVTVHVPAQTAATYRREGWDGWNIVEDQPAVPVNVKWDYLGDDCSGTNTGIIRGMGNNDVEFAMRIPKEQLAPYKGCKVTAIEYHTTPEASNDAHLEEVEYVFVTSPGNDYLAKETANTVRGCWMRVDLGSPVEIGDEDLFVGIGRHRELMTVWPNNTVVDDGFWVRGMGQDHSCPVAPGVWEKHGGQSDCNHPIAVRAVIEGDRLPNDIVVLNAGTVEEDKPEADKAAGKRYDAPKKKSQLRVRMQNRSPRIVNNVTLDWSIDGVAQTPIKFETSLLPNRSDEVVVDIPDDVTGRTHTVAVNVTDIDGEPDEIEANSNVVTTVTTPAAVNFPRRIVMEEATGTWCGYCPEGIATIERMKERYPDNFIAISVHNDEDMRVADGSYATFEEMIGGYPSARVNRMRWQDLSPFDLEGEIDGAEAKIEATASFTGDGRINVATETTFGFSEKGNHAYNIAYVLVEDKVGPYYQVNFSSDPSAPEDPENYLDWWIHQGERVEVLHDDVARAIYNYDGIEGLLPTVFTEGEAIASEYTVDLPSYTQNPANLRVVTLLIDALNGEIMNAASTRISGPLPPSVERVEVSPASAEGHFGETVQLTATVYPENAFDKAVTWSSDNPNVAMVDETGLVQMLSLGTATVTASVRGISGNCQITVTPAPVLVEQIVLTPDYVEAPEGSEVTLSADVYPSDADNTVLEWSSDNEAVATVSQDGVVYIHAPGEALITAAATDGSLVKGFARIVCEAPHTVEQVGVNEEYVEGHVGDTVQLTAWVYPDDAINKTLTWSSDNTEVATVDETGLVRMVGLGSAKVTATAGGISDYCQIEVVPVLVEQVVLTPDEVEALIGSEVTLNAEVIPADADNPVLEWSSDAEIVATVSQDGVVTVHSEGVALITATATDGSQARGYAWITGVSPQPVLVEEILLTPDAVEALEGSEVVLTAEVRPADADNPVLEWSSDNEMVATVSQDGVVYVNAPGEAVITGAATDGSLVKAQALITGISGVDELFDGDTVWSIYDIDGRLLRSELSRGDMELLQPGVYILRSGSRIVKIHVHH